MQRIDTKASDFENLLAQLLSRQTANQALAEVQAQVQQILARVAEHGDAAIFEYTLKFDGYALDSDNIEVPRSRLQQSLNAISETQREALEFAVTQVREYHEHQLQESWSYQTEDGNTLGQKITPIQRAGLYVPGGKASYPSSVIMNAVPAKVAGVAELIMVTPTPKGEFNDMVLAAAYLAGVDRVFRIGGAQAIAALALGTESIPKVDKITGPGNIYVATAKQLVFGQVGIDMLAGPSEVLVIADESANPTWVALDLFAQAEHDEMAQAILLTNSDAMASQVAKEIARLLPTMPRRTIIEQALTEHGAIIVAHSQAELVAIADRIAAEHLEIFAANADELAQSIQHAGAIFIGQNSAESLGDYCAGPNHVLPTSGTARFSSPLGVYDFQKRTSIIKMSERGAQTTAHFAAILADSEALDAHAAAARARIRSTL